MPKRKTKKRERSPEEEKREQERRRKLSASLRNSEAVKAYHDRLRGVKRGPESDTTRARKSASKKAERGTEAWNVFYRQALSRIRLLRRQAEAAEAAFQAAPKKPSSKKRR